MEFRDSTFKVTPINPTTAAAEALPFPLSFAQQRMWFLDQLEPDGSVYNIPIGVRLRGPLHVESLERSLNEIVRRHEVLRAGFPSVGGRPLQLISASLTLSLSVVDLTGFPAAERENEAQRLANEETERPFDLVQGPLLRAALLRVAPEDHVLLLTLHHIVYDAWSTRVLYRELTVLYEAFSKGRSSPLAELPIQYIDFAQWQRDWLQGEMLDQELSYWKKQLDRVSTLQLPVDRPRPAVQSFRAAYESIVLSRELTEEVKTISLRARASLFMTLLAAFKVLLCRYTGQEDIAVGSPIANRGRIEFEGLIGLFLNTLVLRTDLSRNPSFIELLARVREVAFDAYAHQDLPFEKLVEELNPERILNLTPLFQVLFVFQNDAVRELKLSGLTASRFTRESNATQFDLSLIMAETDQGLVARAQYNADLFEPGTMKRMLRHFRTLLKGIIATPKQPILDLPLLESSERDQLLLAWNDTKRDYPSEKCTHQIFEERVELSPEAVAVVFEEQQLTYRELNNRANQLAHYLRHLGVGPEVLVGICVERSIEMVVGLLGILKAGGAFVPLDPDYPKERLSFMLADTQIAVLLTQDRLRNKLPEYGAPVLCLDSGQAEIAQESTETPAQFVSPVNLAYVIYTSGSTGRPKGAMNSHRGLCNRLHWMQQAYQLSEVDRVLQKTPFSFDVSVWEFFWPLITGSRLVMARSGGHQDSRYLVELIMQQQITTLHFVPSMLRLFLEEPEIESCKSLRQVICSGEALSFDLQERFFERISVKLHNLYGPTEASIDVTYWECQKRSTRAIVPIGRPIANTQIYILDKLQNAVPVAVPGELHISGEGLGRGYFNRPELTAEKFVPNPFSGKPGQRLYKTGDLARYLPDGNIEFLGRIDHQVKVRGFRIELGEIETVLTAHPGVRESVAIVREDEPGKKRLVAYVVARNECAPTTSELRGYLKDKLPDYMIPSGFMMLDALPLTPNGKLDSKALPALDQTRPELTEGFVAPRNTAEQTIAQIWAQVLEVDSVGVNDNFFDLGGHSLLATQVMSRLREAFQIEIVLRALFENPTVAELTLQIQTQTKKIVPQKVGDLLVELESLSDEEAELLLAQENFKRV
jgi:amino acid adenylation domain-containing protein